MNANTRKQRLIGINRLIGSSLAQLRREHGLNQEDVAAHMGFKRPLVSKIESGQRALAAAEVFDYADALGIEPRVLFGRIVTIVVEYDGREERVPPAAAPEANLTYGLSSSR